jgi:hypothetical protein
MKDADWDLIIKVHVTGAFKVISSDFLHSSCETDQHSVLVLHGLTSGNKSMVVLLIPLRPPDFSVASAKQTTLVGHRAL